MSRDDATSDIQGMATAVITAYAKYISEHREIKNVSVLTASAFYLAAIVDVLSFGEDDPSQEETLTLIADATTMMLKHIGVIRRHMAAILKSVMEEAQ
jgi:hypothetical protein